MAIVAVLMHGLSSDYEPSESTRLRLDRALDIAKTHDFIITSSGYTIHHAPFLAGNGQPICEADIGAKYLVSRGWPASRAYSERFSQDTIGNAFFLRQLFLEPLQERAWTIVTSKFHRERTELIFRWIFSLEPECNVNLSFEDAQDPNWDSELSEAIARKESRSVQELKRRSSTIHGLLDFTNWMFRDHSIYAFEKQAEECSPLELRAYKQSAT